VLLLDASIDELVKLKVSSVMLIIVDDVEIKTFFVVSINKLGAVVCNSSKVVVGLLICIVLVLIDVPSVIVLASVKLVNNISLVVEDVLYSISVDLYVEKVEVDIEA
jgi:hypothetical protein